MPGTGKFTENGRYVPQVCVGSKCPILLAVSFDYRQRVQFATAGKVQDALEMISWGNVPEMVCARLGMSAHAVGAMLRRYAPERAEFVARLQHDERIHHPLWKAS